MKERDEYRAALLKAKKDLESEGMDPRWACQELDRLDHNRRGRFWKQFLSGCVVGMLLLSLIK